MESTNKVLIIAEAGVNHNGSIELAKKLVDVAVEAGVDYVKFQTFKAEKIISAQAQKAAYQIENTNNKVETQLEMVKKLELDKEKHEILIDYCKQKGIKFLSTAFDLDSIDLLEELDIDLYKIPSGEITNLPYLKKIASKGKPVILSTGMANLGEIETTINVLYSNGVLPNDLTILHCNTEYPTPIQDVNLKAMQTIQQAFKTKVGYSDHTLGIEVPIAAVAMGAICIEKHFTLDRTMEGPDHRASLEPDELISMVAAIRNIEQALGNGIKAPSISELQNISIVRKSIHLAIPLKKGEIISEESLQMMRPGDGITPMNINQIIGRNVNKDLEVGYKLKLEDFF